MVQSSLVSLCFIFLAFLIYKRTYYIAQAEAARREAQERATACYEAGRCSGDTIYW